MSTAQIAIEVTANTGAAKQALDELADATRDTKTAAEGAGKAQKELAKEVAQAKQKQVETTAAVRAAKDAQQEHNLTVQAFGKDSKEAAASSAKMKAAQEQAAASARAANSALEQTAKNVTAVARGEGEASPAVRRLGTQLQKMGGDADRTAGELRRLDLQMAATERQSKRGSEGLDLMGLASGKLMSILGPAALAGTVVAIAGYLGEAAEKTLQYETALSNLPFSLDGAKAATHGLVSEQMLVNSAASATSLKVTKTAGDFELLAGASVKLAQKLGQPADQLLNNLVTALGRGSTELLDNAGVVLKTAEAQERYATSIGVSVSALTDEQKASAFKVEAMKAILKAADETTVSFDSNAAAVVRLKVKAGDAWDSMERGAANAAGSIISVLESANTSISTLQHGLIETALAMDTTWSPAFKSGAADAASWAAEILGVQDTVAGIRAGLSDPAVVASMKAANDQEREKRDQLAEEAAYSERAAKAIAEIEKSNAAWLDAQAANSVVYGPAAPDKPKKRGGKKKDPNALAMDQMDFTSDVNNFAAGQAKAIRKERADAAKEAEQLRAKQYEAEVKLREEKLAGIDAEIAALDDLNLREAQRIDAVFFVIDQEGEAEVRRRELQDQRMVREQQLADWQMQNAKTEEERAAAQTRSNEVQQQKRMAVMLRAAAEEKRIQSQRAAVAEKVLGHVEGLGTAMADAAWEAADGQKGAGLQALGDYLKTVSKQMAVKAAVETALGVSALAGVVTAGLAPGHFAAAGLAAAAAIAAGGAGYGLSEAGKARADADKPPEKKADGTIVGSDVKGDPNKALEPQAVPVSYEQGRRDMATEKALAKEVHLHLQINGNVIGAGGVRQVGAYLQSVLDEYKRGGGDKGRPALV